MREYLPKVPSLCCPGQGKFSIVNWDSSQTPASGQPIFPLMAHSDHSWGKRFKKVGGDRVNTLEEKSGNFWGSWKITDALW